LKRILLNLIYLNHRVGGAWNYTDNFLKALPQTDTISYFAVCNQQSQCLAQQLVPEKNIAVVCSQEQSTNLLIRTFYEFTTTRRYVKKWNIDAIHWFGNHAASLTNTTCFITVHDLQPLELKNSLLKKWYHKLLYTVNANSEKNIFLPISEFTRKKLCSIINPKIVADFIIPNALSFNYSGVNSDADIEPDISIKNVDTSSANKDFLSNFLPSIPYILYVSHFYSHKNHIRLIEAFEQIAKTVPDVHLVLRGDRQDAYEKSVNRIKRSSVNDRITILPRLSAPQLQQVYQNAKGLIFPSLYEGGGIPVMEAYNFHLPVACSDLPVFNEFYGSLPKYFNPTSIKDIKQALLWLINFEKNKEFTRKAEEIIAKFQIPQNRRRIKKLYDQYLFTATEE